VKIGGTSVKVVVLETIPPTIGFRHMFGKCLHYLEFIPWLKI